MHTAICGRLTNSHLLINAFTNYGKTWPKLHLITGRARWRRCVFIRSARTDTRLWLDPMRKWRWRSRWRSQGARPLKWWPCPHFNRCRFWTGAVVPLDTWKILVRWCNWCICHNSPRTGLLWRRLRVTSLLFGRRTFQSESSHWSWWNSRRGKVLFGRGVCLGWRSRIGRANKGWFWRTHDCCWSNHGFQVWVPSNHGIRFWVVCIKQ